MRTKPVAIAVALSALGCAASAGANPASQVAIFGITLGQPLQIQECRLIPTSEAEKKMAERYAKRGLSYLANPFPKYEEPSTEPCYKRLAKERLGTAIGTEKLHIAFPVSQRLAGSDGTSVAVQMIDGRVQYLRFGTRGRFWQDEDLEIFKAKFGEPETVQPVALQNGFGARYTALEASWTPTSGLVARFESWVSDRAGNFEIGTPEAAKLFWDMPKQPTRAL